MKELKTVMLIDDDETTNFLNSYFISQLDTRIKIITMHNGKEAMDYLEANKYKSFGPCLIILDTNMPIMTGWEFLEVYEAKANTELKEQITIVMVTALESKDVVEEALAMPNVVDTVQKPLSDLKFRMLINKHFMQEEAKNSSKG